MGGIRGKKVKGSGRTKNVSGRLPGPKYGMKCYDGQRVPPGTILLKQKIPNTFPGWNVSCTSKKYYLFRETDETLKKSLSFFLETNDICFRGTDNLVIIL